MAEIVTASDLGLSLNGRLAVWSVSADTPMDEVLANLGTPIMEVDNLVVSTAVDAIVRLLRGQTKDYLPSFISIGSGGDLDQVTLLDTGARVGPNLADSYMRATTTRIPILTTEDGEESNEWSYVAVARPHEALSPIINELAVETGNGTLISHYITDADPSGRATRYCKTSLEYLIIRWTYSLSLSISGSIIIDETPTGTYLVVVDENGDTIFTILAEPRPGAATSTALLSQVTTGESGTIDVQINGTLTSQLVSGGSATITLQVIS